MRKAPPDCVRSPTAGRRLIRSALVVVTLAALATTVRRPVSAETSPSANVVPLTVRTPRAGFNRLVVTVTVCVPGTQRCRTIDNVMVDTGSVGLRLEASALSPGLGLPAFAGSDGRPLAECLHFVHDAAWGPLYRADLRIGGLTAPDLPLQIIADDGRAPPATCPSSTVTPTSNGTLGVGPSLFDCQGACEQSEGRPGVFVDRDGAWSPVRGPVPPTSRLPNPVSLFPDHANGVVFDLPASVAGGSDEVTGTLTVGLDAAAGDQLDAARIIRPDGRGLVTTIYDGASYPRSYIDSGTETNILADKDLPRCPGMSWAFCATPDRKRAASIIGADGRPVPVTFTIGDYRDALKRHVGAWDGFAEAADPASAAFVWGAPFFLGRRVYLVLDGKSVPGTALKGPAYGIR